jgi:hypothetical protein
VADPANGSTSYRYISAFLIVLLKIQFPVVLRRGAVDLTGTGQVKSDYWHRGLQSDVVSRNHSQFPGIRFFSEDGVGSGVAMTECEYSVGMASASQSVFEQLPPLFQQAKSGTFIISASTIPLPVYVY